MQENTFKISLSGGKKSNPKTKRADKDAKKFRPLFAKENGQKEGLSMYDRIWAFLDKEIDTSVKY